MSVCTKPGLQNGAREQINAGDDVIRREQYAQSAQTAARNKTIKKNRHQVGERIMQLFCSCDVVLTLKLVCGLTKKKSCLM